MHKIAVVFSGQGAQSAGMGKDLYDNFKSSREIFDTAEKLRSGTIAQCFEGSKEELSKTSNTQPCLFTVDVAAYAALKESGITAQGFAGFSLGELAAVVCGGMLEFEQGFELVCQRAQIMDRQQGGAMAAVLKLSSSEVEKLCDSIKDVYPVNYNCPGQTVVAGSMQSIDKLIAEVAAMGGRAVKLAVGGAFHSPFMEEAYIQFSEVLCGYKFSVSRAPIYSNVTAKPYDDDAARLLSLQVKSAVLWQKTIGNMIADGFDTFIEAGWGNTLFNLIKRISENVNVFSATNYGEILRIKQTINNDA